MPDRVRHDNEDCHPELDSGSLTVAYHINPSILD